MLSPSPRQRLDIAKRRYAVIAVFVFTFSDVSIPRVRPAKLQFARAASGQQFRDEILESLGAAFGFGFRLRAPEPFPGS